MTGLDDRLAGLSPEKRRLLQKRLAQQRRAAAPAAIPKSGQDRAPLTFAQRRLWFLEQLAPGSPVYNNPSAIDVVGALDVDALTRAFAGVVRRHEALRTRFVPDGDEANQVIVPFGASPGGTVELALEDLRALPPDARSARIRDLLVDAAEDPFDLANGPPMRALLLRQTDTRWTLAVTFHHIVSDAWSAQRFLVELVAGYRAAATGREPALPKLPIQYGDFARWQRSEQRVAELQRQRAWWIERLSGAPAATALPLDRPRRATPSAAGDVVRFGLDRETTAALRRLASEHDGTTLFMVLLAGFSALLHRLSGDTDLCLGTAIAGRNRPETEPLIGLFMNTLVLRVDASGRPTFRTLVERARATAVGAFANPDVPFEQLVDGLAVPRDPSTHPVFQVLFLLQNVPVADNPLAELDLELELRPSTNRRARFDLTMNWLEGDDGLSGAAEFATERLDRDTVERWCSAYRALLTAAVADPDTRIDDLPLGLPPSVREGRTEPPCDTGTTAAATVDERFAAIAATRPDAPAVGTDGRWWSYAELDEHADQLARVLAARGVGPEARVGLAADRGFLEWVGMLGAWKAGAAYVPLDPTFPVDRLAWIVASSALDLVLTAGTGAELALPAGVETLALESVGAPGGVDGTAAGPRPGEPERLAYVLYTSGSTGRPKGVGVSHRAAVAFLDAITARLGWTAGLRMLSVTTLGFDIALLERWGPLFVGGDSQVVAAVEAADGAALGARLAASGANALQGTPATWRLLRDAGWQGDDGLQALVGGEALPAELARWIAGRTAATWNLYGPTETTVWSTAHRFDASRGREPREIVQLGEPLGATRLAILDPRGRATPLGIWGELAIGGPGVARGYERRAAETAVRFVPDPFDAAPGTRLYRTGDVCRMRPDGDLEFGGRRDGQVKLRGYRIETGEIEARLAACEGVATSAVVAVGETLVAFVTPDVGTEAEAVDVDALAAELARSLPAYMVPRRIEVQPALPLTPNGKLDRRALAERARATRAKSADYVAPRTPTEAVVAEIFGEVLELPRVSVEANFFELGGHSLLATRIAARVRESLRRDLPLRVLFEAPTAATLAVRIDALGVTTAGRPLVAVPHAERPASIPCTHAQERLWFLDQLHPGDPAYAIPLLLRLEGTVDVDALGRALRDVVRRHEVLRTTFATVAGRVEQRVHAPDSELAQRAVGITEMDLSALAAGEAQTAAIRAHALRCAQDPFLLADGPLLRTLLLRLGAHSHLAMLVMHHIVSDGWSVGVLARELTTLYEARRSGTPSPLPPPSIQYADWAIHERAMLDEGAVDAEMQHWARTLRDVPSELVLPADRDGSGTGPRRAARHRVQLGATLAAGVRDLARSHDTTLFAVLLAAYGAALYVEGGGDDLVIGCPAAGRDHPRIEASIGFFVNTLPLRLRFTPSTSLWSLVTDARDVTLAGLAHRRLPFPRIAEAAAAGSRAPTSLGQLWFVLQNVPRPELALGGDLTVEPVPAEDIARFANGLLPARYDLKLELMENGHGEDGDGDRGGTVVGGLEYRVDRFDAATIERLADRLIELLQAMVHKPERTLGEWRGRAAAHEAEQLADHRRRGLASLRTRPASKP
ncbi:MAG: amino acid adenylation domain-containing protein [Planctomycetota bacterium]